MHLARVSPHALDAPHLMLTLCVSTRWEGRKERENRRGSGYEGRMQGVTRDEREDQAPRRHSGNTICLHIVGQLG